MKRPWQIWVVFGLCLVIVLAALAWVSLTTMRLERAQEEARQQALLEENVRLALWRMDSALGPLIAQETARPYFDYNAFYAAERAYSRMFNPIDRGEVLVPSPLLGDAPPYILLHFQFGPDGALTSPQAPEGNMRDLAEAGYTTHQRVQAADARLERVRGIVSPSALLAELKKSETRGRAPWGAPLPGGGSAALLSESQQARNTLEWQARAGRQRQTNLEQAKRAQAWPGLPAADVIVNALVPVWVGEEVGGSQPLDSARSGEPAEPRLLLVRQVWANGTPYLQGCWLDWPAIRSWLLAIVRDLLPHATLEPVRPRAMDASFRGLAALPVRVDPRSAPAGKVAWSFPVWLLILWGVVIAAAAGAAGLVGGIVSLSERRAAFASAVTHELRTPLTTLRMYAEMLTEGMIPQEEARRQYLRTLLAEADRLSHLVENVLAYAQLERGRPEDRMEPVSVGDLLDRVEGRLRSRAEHADMELVVEAEEDALPLTVQVDPSAVEQILFNLVDNACKYAASASDRLIHLNVGRSSQTVLLRVRDHGPGVSPEETRRLFRPFSKSAGDAANTAPGVGLGLALSRGLARRMGGDLSLEREAEDGACFVLRLPAS